MAHFHKVSVSVQSSADPLCDVNNKNKLSLHRYQRRHRRPYFVSEETLWNGWWWRIERTSQCILCFMNTSTRWLVLSFCVAFEMKKKKNLLPDNLFILPSPQPDSIIHIIMVIYKWDSHPPLVSPPTFHWLVHPHYHPPPPSRDSVQSAWLCASPESKGWRERHQVWVFELESRRISGLVQSTNTSKYSVRCQSSRPLGRISLSCLLK